MKTNIKTVSLRLVAIVGLLLGGLTAPCYADILYVANTGNNTIVKFTSGGVASVFANSGLDNPVGLAFDSAGNLYVANAGNSNTIVKFTPGGVGSVFANSGVINPRGLAFDSAGNLYVANAGNNTIVKFTPGGVGSVFANSGLINPQGLAFDSAGNLYVVNAGSGTGAGIVRFTPGGVGSVFASFGFNSSPQGLAFDSAGNLYVAIRGNDTIEKFTPGGVGSVFANSDLSVPTFLAFTDDAGQPPPVDIIAQECPCIGPASGGAWRNHGQYVSCVAKAAEDLLSAGRITEEEQDSIVESAAQSNCGKKRSAR